MSTAAPEPLAPKRVADRATYAVAGGNHVTLLLDRSHTAAALDVIEVLAQPGGGPPPQSGANQWHSMRMLVSDVGQNSRKGTPVGSTGATRFG